MCRLLAYVSENETDFPTMVGENFEEFVELSRVHKDGWGIVNRNGEVIKEADAAFANSNFKEVLEKNKSTGSLLHFRMATLGLPIEKDNSHPFSYKEYSFIHNGSVTPPTALDSSIQEKYLSHVTGDTDSERYFFLVVQEVEKLG